jgi:hypothetical protein
MPTRIMRRVLSLVGGLLIAALGVWLAIHDPMRIGSVFRAGVPSEVGTQPVYHRFADAYAHLSYVGVALAGALAFALLVWERRPRRWIPPTLVAVTLFVAFTLSFFNYFSGDFYVPRYQQAIIDLILVFLGVVCVLMLLKVQVSSTSGQVLKCMAVGLLCLEAIVTPGIYGTLWLLNAQGMIGAAESNSWNPSWISAVAALGSLAISVLTYRRARQTPSAPAGAGTPLVRL